MYHILASRIKVGLIVAMALAALLLPGDRVEGHGGDPTLIHSCRNANGNFKIVAANATCQTGRTPLDWDAAATLGGQLASSYARRDTANNFTSGDQTIAGNVGIGTTGPGVKLHIQSNTDTDWDPNLGNTNAVLLLQNTTVGTNNPVSIQFATGSNGEVRLAAIDNAVTGDADLRFNLRRSGADRFDVVTLKASGNVGIGTASPSAKLSVAAGDVATTGAGNGFIVKSPNGLVCGRIGIDNSGAITTTVVACP